MPSGLVGGIGWSDAPKDPSADRRGLQPGRSVRPRSVSLRPTVDVTAATDAANPACAPMMVALPDKIGDAALRKTNSRATAARAILPRSSCAAV